MSFRKKCYINANKYTVAVKLFLPKQLIIRSAAGIFCSLSNTPAAQGRRGFMEEQAPLPQSACGTVKLLKLFYKYHWD